ALLIVASFLLYLRAGTVLPSAHQQVPCQALNLKDPSPGDRLHRASIGSRSYLEAAYGRLPLAFEAKRGPHRQVKDFARGAVALLGGVCQALGILSTVILLAACVGRSRRGGGGAAVRATTPPGTYAIAVTATSGTSSHNAILIFGGGLATRVRGGIVSP